MLWDNPMVNVNLTKRELPDFGLANLIRELVKTLCIEVVGGLPTRRPWPYA